MSAGRVSNLMVDSLSNMAECCPSESGIIFFQWIINFTNFIVYDLLDLYPMETKAALLHFFIRTSIKIFSLLTIMVYLIGLARAGLDVESVRLWLKGKNQFVSLLLAALLGAVTPFCSCSAIPIFIAFTASGIPLGVTIAFLVTSPIINEVAVVLLVSEFGVKFMIVYVALGILSGMFAGYFFDLINAQRLVIPFNGDENAIGNKKKSGVTFKYRHQFAFNEVKKIVGKIWLFVLVAIIVAACFHVFLSSDHIAKLVQQSGILSVPIAVILGIPLYSSPAAIIPLAKTLFDKGMPLGTVMAFMMSCTAASLPEFMLLKQILKIKALVILFVFFLFAFTLLGLLINLFN